MADVNIDIGVDTKNAIKSITTFGKKSTKTLARLESSFGALKTVAAGAVGFLAGRQLIRSLNTLTEAAAIQEDAINELNIALRNSGKFTEDASQDFQNYASSIQEATKFGDEQLLSNAALIQSLGQLETDGLKKATVAATDLAAALNVDLRTASLLVGKAAAGEISTFSRYGLVIKKGADNAETFANVLDAINNKFGGAAAAQVNTYSGAIQQLTNVQGDLNEELGFTITRNPAVIAAVKAVNEGFQNLIEFVKENRDEINKYVKESVRDLIDILPKSIRLLGKFAEGWQFLKFAVSDVALAILSVNEQILKAEKFISSFNTAASKPTNQLKKLNEAFKGAGEGADTLSILMKGLGENGGTIDQALEGVRQSRVELFKLRTDSIDASNEIQLAFSKIESGIIKTTDQLKEFIDAQKNSNKAATEGAKVGKAYSKGFLGALEEGFEIVSDILIENINVENISKALSGALADGKKGAKDLITGLASGVVDILAPGLGSALKPVLDALALGPKNAKEQAKAFAEELPQIVENIVEGLIEGLPAFIDNFVRVFLEEGGIVRIVDALVRLAPRIGVALAKSTYNFLLTVWNGLWDISAERFREIRKEWVSEQKRGIREAFGPQIEQLNAFGKKLNTTPQWIKDLQNTLSKKPQWVQDLQNALSGEGIKKAVGGLSTERVAAGILTGGASEILIRTGAIPSFQTGGVTQGGLTNLHKGELVVPTDTTQNLFSAIDRLGGGGESGVLEALLVRVIALLESPTETTATLNLDGESFADIMLRLDRLNARTAA